MCCCRQLFGARGFWGLLTGPNPTDRAKRGSKRHLICDGNGIPLAIKLTGANFHDSTQALPLLDGIPLLQGPRGRPPCRPDSVLGDRAYDAERIRVLCVAAKSCLGSQCAIRSMVAGWGDCAGLWNVRSHG